MKKLSEEHKKKISESLRIFHNNLKESINLSKREYRIKNNLCIRCGSYSPHKTHLCKECLAIYKEKYGESKKSYRDGTIQLVIEHYGGICNCCGESNPLFLTIDHINGGGNKHRLSISKSDKPVGGQVIYYWIIKNDFPSDFQILCFNCNLGKTRNKGVCPHKLFLKSDDVIAEK